MLIKINANFLGRSKMLGLSVFSNADSPITTLIAYLTDSGKISQFI